MSFSVAFVYINDSAFHKTNNLKKLRIPDKKYYFQPCLYPPVALCACTCIPFLHSVLVLVLHVCTLNLFLFSVLHISTLNLYLYSIFAHLYLFFKVDLCPNILQLLFTYNLNYECLLVHCPSLLAFSFC